MTTINHPSTLRARRSFRTMVWLVAAGSVMSQLVGWTASADRPVPLAGLTARARMLRDEHGVAHLYAQNQHDLFFLQGYAQAEDRLFQMDVTRRLGSGQSPEQVGGSPWPKGGRWRRV